MIGCRSRPSSVTCAHCGARTPVGGMGPIPVYCGGACRQAAYRERHGLVEVPRGRDVHSYPTVLVRRGHAITIVDVTEPVLVVPEGWEW